MLLNQKREAEADLLRERTKRQKLELSQKSWKTKFRNAIKKLKALKNKKKVRGKEINKSFSDYSVKQKQRIKMMMSVQQHLTFSDCVIFFQPRLKCLT